MFCKKCGAKMEDSYNVCQECGTQKGLGNSFCPNCGNIHNMNSAFCENCGYKFEEVQQQSPVQDATIPYSQQTPYQQFSSMAQQPNSQYMPPEKYCRGCGNKLTSSQVICTNCGTKVGQGTSFCQHCGAPTQLGAEACMSCGKSLKNPIDINSQLTGLKNNFNGIFDFSKYTVKDMIFEWGVYLGTALIFIISLLPCVFVESSILGYRETMNSFKVAGGFCGFLFLLALFVGVARFVPYVNDLLENNAWGQYAIFAAPALQLIALLVIIVRTANASSDLGVYGSAGLAFFGWVLALLVIASVALSVLSYLRKQGKITI